MLIAVTLSGLVSCSSGLAENGVLYEEHFENNVSKYKSLRFVNNWGDNDSYAEVLQDIFDDFMEDNPEVKIVNESMSGIEFIKKFKIDFASGNEPDIFSIGPGSDIKGMIESGKIADLTTMINNDPEWQNSFKKLDWNGTLINGKLYGLPLEVMYVGLFINKDLFNKYNLKEPQDYNDLKNVILTFQKNDIIPFALNTKKDYSYLYQLIVANIGGKAGVEKPFVNGEPNYCYEKGLEVMKELYNLNLFNSDLLTIDRKQKNNLFLNKKAAMTVQSSSFNYKFKDDDNSVKVIPFPYINIPGAKKNTIINDLGEGVFYVSKRAWEDINKRANIIKLLRILTSSKTASKFAEKGMLCNVSHNMKESNVLMSGIDVIEKSYEKAGLPSSYIDRAAWENVLSENLPKYLEKDNNIDIWKSVIDYD